MSSKGQIYSTGLKKFQITDKPKSYTKSSPKTSDAHAYKFSNYCVAVWVLLLDSNHLRQAFLWIPNISLCKFVLVNKKSLWKVLKMCLIDNRFFMLFFFVCLVWWFVLWGLVFGLNSTVRAAKGKWILSQSDPTQGFVGFFMPGNI